MIEIARKDRGDGLLRKENIYDVGSSSLIRLQWRRTSEHWFPG